LAGPVGLLLVTLKTPCWASRSRSIGGVTLAVLLSLSRIVEYSLYPLRRGAAGHARRGDLAPAADLPAAGLAVLACAWIVAFFPCLSNTTLGPAIGRPQPARTVRLYGRPGPEMGACLRGPVPVAPKGLWYLRRPAALPYFLAGLKIAGGLSLIGAVVAEIAAGSAGAGSGLAIGSSRANTASTSAPLRGARVAGWRGVVIFLAMSALSHLLLRSWHESAMAQER
jgi:NitT/TauT family transport system permease protein